MKRIGLFVGIGVVIALFALFLVGETAASPSSWPPPPNCFKVDVNDAFKSASGDVSDKCPGAQVTSVCLKAGLGTYCTSNSCFTISYSGSTWSVSENWPGNNKGPGCKDISNYTVCWSCPPPPPQCSVVDTHYGEWSCGNWDTCTAGVQERTCSRDVWTTDHFNPSIECSRTTENKTETQWCDICLVTDTHYGDWGEWTPWSECVNGEHTRTRVRDVWTTDINHPSVECDRWTETETQTEDCNLCIEVDTHYGPWSSWSDWSDCVDGEQSRTRTREVWTTDVNHPEYECSRDIETETETQDCEVPKAKCNEACQSSKDCVQNLVCDEALKVCVNSQCPGDADCVCKVPEKNCNAPCKEDAECKSDFCFEGRCRIPECPWKADCICEAPCWTRLDVSVGGCIPGGLKISIWGPEGGKVKDVPWTGETILVDLDFNKTYTIKGWTETGGFVTFGTITTPKKCGPPIDFNHAFPCPIPTPTPPEVVELPITGGVPPSESMNLFVLGGLGGISFLSAALANKLRRRSR